MDLGLRLHSLTSVLRRLRVDRWEAARELCQSPLRFYLMRSVSEDIASATPDT
jgi:hypothetical protein